ncbi:MAG: hypothetical protein ABSE57_27930 [Bryobacteraceae bacterium]|jgi:hypothetical protein
MAKAHKFDFENPATIFDEEDEETLAAIDEASGTPKLAELCLRKKSANSCPSGLPSPLHVDNAIIASCLTM